MKNGSFFTLVRVFIVKLFQPLASHGLVFPVLKINYLKSILLLSLGLLHGCTVYTPVIVPGTYISEPEGPLFQETPLLDERNAMIYIYRPRSEWADDELEAPSFYLGEERLFGLKSGQYIWLEFYAGDGELLVKRSFLGLNIKDIATLSLDLKAGETRYFRYSEDSALEDPEEPPGAVFADPIREVSATLALPELAQMRLVEPGTLISCNVEESPWITFKLPPRAGHADKCEIPQPKFKPIHKRRHR